MAKTGRYRTDMQADFCGVVQVVALLVTLQARCCTVA